MRDDRLFDPTSILSEFDEFRGIKISQGKRMRETWLNDFASVFLENYPKDWSKRKQLIFKGKALTFHTVGRKELVYTKVWGFCQLRRADLETLKILKATKDELIEAIEWTKKQEPTTAFWEETVDKKLIELFVEFGHE